MDFPVESWPIERLTKNPRNYRSHPPEQILHLRESLRKHGFQKPIVALPDGTMLAGHGLEIAAAEEGFAEVPVHVYQGPDPEHYMVADNEVSRLAVDDGAMLAALLGELKERESLAGTGHDEATLAALLAETAAPYSPNLTPDLQQREYDEGDVESQKKRLEEQYQQQRALEPVICPKCGEEFFLDKG